jgi:hypothetical protein
MQGARPNISIRQGAEGSAETVPSGDEVGMEAQDAQPAVLIEKDFQCVHEEHRDPEAYPNPLSN